MKIKKTNRNISKGILSKIRFLIFQVSNWFINARVRLWKPMVEDMYQQEAKEGEGDGDGDDKSQSQNSGNNNIIAQTPTPNSMMSNSSSTNMTTTTTATTTAVAAAETATAATPITVTSSKRSQINATDSDPSIVAINSFSENQANFPTNIHDPDTCRRGNFSGDGTATHDHMGSTMIRFGTTSGDVSLTLGLRHAGNLPENTHFFG